jgi:hypothetical protein
MATRHPNEPLFALTAGEAQRVNRVRICQRMGWRFDYYDALSLADVADVAEVMRAEDMLKKVKHRG